MDGWHFSSGNYAQGLLSPWKNFLYFFPSCQDTHSGESNISRGVVAVVLGNQVAMKNNTRTAATGGTPPTPFSFHPMNPHTYSSLKCQKSQRSNSTSARADSFFSRCRLLALSARRSITEQRSDVTQPPIKFIAEPYRIRDRWPSAGMKKKKWSMMKSTPRHLDLPNNRNSVSSSSCHRSASSARFAPRRNPRAFSFYIRNVENY